MTVATVKVVVLLVALMVEVQTVKTVYMILPLMVVNVVILPGMNLVLTAPHLKALMAGIVQAVLVLEITAALMAVPMVVIVVLVM